MMNKKPLNKFILPSFLVLLAAPGTICFYLYQWGKRLGWIDPILIYANRKEFSNLTAGYAFTMLGFMAAIITILFAFSNSRNFRQYKEKGYLRIFFWGYFLCIFTLMLTAFFSVFGFSQVGHVWQHHALLISFFSSLWQVGLLTLIIVNIARQSA